MAVRHGGKGERDATILRTMGSCHRVWNAGTQSVRIGQCHHFGHRSIPVFFPLISLRYLGSVGSDYCAKGGGGP